MESVEVIEQKTGPYLLWCLRFVLFLLPIPETQMYAVFFTDLDC